MKYRPEIDGLRAIAVVSVILCHTELGLLEGGYVGVDIFFVISGFLISTIIIGAIEAKTFSPLEFYERRARRILPALFVVMLACIPFAWTMLMPDFLQNFGQSLVATTLFANNILLWKTSGYWALESSFKPLLHTWSLGVEEQYYLLAPLFLALAWPRLRGRTQWIILGLGAASFATYLALLPRAPEFSFYLLPTRAWELLMGMGAAIWVRRQHVQPKSGVLAAVGLILILGCVVLLRPASTASAALVVVACIGSVLILVFARPETLVGKLLSSPPFVGLGLISYSLYLWHQPVFAFARVNSFEKPGALLMIGLLPLITILSYLSWRFIERPFRDPGKVSKRALICVLAFGAALLCGAGAAMHLADGFPSRFFKPGQGQAMDNTIRYNMQVMARKADRFSTDGPLRLLVIGNSQARDFVNMAAEAGRFAGYDLVYRDDIDLCRLEALSEVQRTLVDRADYMVVPLGEPLCPALARRSSALVAKRIVFLGPKHFGYNLNRFARLPRSARPTATAQVPKEIVDLDRRLKAQLPEREYVDILLHVSHDGTRIPIFGDDGALLTPDRVHLTRAGARMFGRLVFADPAWSDFPAAGAPTPQGPLQPRPRQP